MNSLFTDFFLCDVLYNVVVIVMERDEIAHQLGSGIELWHKSNRYRFLTHRQKWHSLNRNAWHYKTEITGTNRTELTRSFF